MRPVTSTQVSKLNFLVRWSNGIAVRYGETKLLFDPLESDPDIPALFISHAHYDHARGFDFPIQKKYSTKESLDLYEADTGRKVGNWQQVRSGRRIKLGEVEVEGHDAGHVLGSLQYELITLQGNAVYASHINFTDTLLSRAAEVAPCDLLIIEAAYHSTTQIAQRESVVADMVKWALDCIKEKRIPTFVTEPIGTAQELVKIFNLWTEIPVIVHPRIAKINRIYENTGTGLRYMDASTEDALEVVEESRCAVIVPRRFDVSRYGNFRTAYVSEWSGKGSDEAAEVLFPLRDRSGFDELLKYVEEARPKTVLTFHGASSVLAEMISKRLGISARSITTERPRKKVPQIKIDEKRVSAFQQTLSQFIRDPGITYDKRELMALGLREGLRKEEIEETLARLTNSGVLKYSAIVDGYSLSSG